MKFATMGRFAIVVACAGMLSVLAPKAASAGTSPGTLTVTASVADKCTVGSPTLAFGAYDPLVTNSVTDLAGSTSLTYACVKDPGHVIWIDLGQGSNYGSAASPYNATYNAMTDGTDFLAYELCQDAACTKTWTTGDPGASPVTNKGVRVASPGIAGSSTTIYGLVLHAQDVGVGSYSDSVAITINF